jgi:hypothetical protein
MTRRKLDGFTFALLLVWGEGACDIAAAVAGHCGTWVP